MLVISRFVRVLVLGGAGLVGCASAPSSAFDGRDDGNGDDSNEGASTSSGDGGAFIEGTGDGGSSGTCSPGKGNYDIPGNHCDDDGDGKVDNPVVCDNGLAANGSAEDFARALGICAKASDKGYGLVSAKFTRGYNRSDAPNAAQHGVLGRFGSVLKPREGSTLGVLSTGYAQEYDGANGAPFGGVVDNGFGGGGENGVDWFDARSNPGNGTLPPGFPKAAAGCRQANTANDVIDVVLTLKAPKNASGFKFDFNFMSGEWPAYICTEYNDGFIAYLRSEGVTDNISFDKQKNPVSVNNGFFDRCTPNVTTGCAGTSPKTSQCPGGTGELGGTGFGVSGAWCSPFNGSSQRSTSGGATGWLTSQAPIKAGEQFSLELMIWDTGDGVLDSSVLVDDFTWIEGAVQTTTDRPK